MILSISVFYTFFIISNLEYVLRSVDYICYTPMDESISVIICIRVKKKNRQRESSRGSKRD